MIWIRVRRSEADGPTTRETRKVTACAVCGGPAAGRGYDGLDPNGQRDPHTGRAWSADMTQYRPGARPLTGSPLGLATLPGRVALRG
jgi:hypothetical protein